MDNTNTLVNILNTIRDNSSAEYQERVPEATRSNIVAVGDPILNYSPIANEFVSALVNRIAFTIIQSKIRKNPLEMFKKGNKPLGDDVQEVFVNLAEGSTYDQSGANLLNRKLPDVKVVYHRMNRQDMYKVTINQPLLAKAFVSYNNLQSFINGIINSLYAGDEYDQFILFKNVLNEAINTNGIKLVAVDAVEDETTGKAFVKLLRTLSTNMTFMSSDYNAYLDVQSTDNKPIKTFTPRENQVIVIRSDIDASIDVDVLAAAFNMDKAEFLARRIIVDKFDNEGVIAVLMDIATPQIYDDLYRMESFYNPEGLYWNYMLHHWQTLSYSLFTNAIAFTDFSKADYGITYTLDAGITSTNTATTKRAGSSYQTTLKLAEGVTLDDVEVTMGGTDITDDVYDSDTKKIAIPSVEGAIVITATKDV